MKKPIYLYILTALSVISSVSRIWSSFMTKFDEASIRSTYESVGLSTTDGSIEYQEAIVNFVTNIPNKTLAILLVALLVAVIVFLIKKNTQVAAFTYIAYLFGTLIEATYSYVGTNSYVSLYKDSMLQSTIASTNLWSYVISIILFLVYLGLTLFFTFRKPKEKPSLDQNSTDI